ncbi:MAG: site-specific DNA-methyltransferase, partial [Chloroflexales bacterium]
GNSAVPLGIAFDSISGDEAGAIFARLAPLAKRWVVSFLDWRHVGTLEAACNDPAFGLRFVRHAIWVGPNKAPQFTGDRPGTGWESIAVLHNPTGRMRWNGGGRHGVYTCNVAHKDHRISNHPNAKPLPLLAQLIADFSDPGDLVLDPFCGSGAVLAAAKLAGRRAVGVEQNEQHCADLVFWLEHGRPRKVAPAAIGVQGSLW